MRYFYNTRNLAMLESIEACTRFVSHDHHCLALQRSTLSPTHVLALDLMGSALAYAFPSGRMCQAYSPFGFTKKTAAIPVGFNGGYLDLANGCYGLGNGHRWYSPALMRFTTTDTLSPFGKGGINAYCYVLNDPVNRYDPDGRTGEKYMHLRNLKPVIRDSNNFGIYLKPSHIKNKSDLILHGHGSYNSIKIGDSVHDANTIPALIKSLSIQLPDIEDIFLLSCNSGAASGSLLSLAQRIANITSRPTYGFDGTIQGSIKPDGANGYRARVLAEIYPGFYPLPFEAKDDIYTTTPILFYPNVHTPITVSKNIRSN